MRPFTLRIGRALIAVIVSILAVAATAGAQAPTVAPGTRVRVQRGYSLWNDPVARYSIVIGSLVRADWDSVVVSREGQLVAIPRADVSALAVKVGERPRGPRVLGGAAIGLGVGALTGMALVAASGDECDSGSYCMSQDEAMGAAALLVGVLGMSVGAIVGVATSGERWRYVALPAPARVGLMPTSRGVAIQLRF